MWLGYSDYFSSMELTVVILNASRASHLGEDPHGINDCVHNDKQGRAVPVALVLCSLHLQCGQACLALGLYWARDENKLFL